MYDSYKDKEYIKNNLFDDVMFLASLKKIPDITVDELDRAIHSLKQNQCKDPHNIKNEVYTQLRKSCRSCMVRMFNTIRNGKKLPESCKNTPISPFL